MKFSVGLILWLGQSDAQDLGGLLCVLIHCVIEVTTSEKQDSIGMLFLQGFVLVSQRGSTFLLAGRFCLRLGCGTRLFLGCGFFTRHLLALSLDGLLLRLFFFLFLCHNRFYLFDKKRYRNTQKLGCYSH